MDGGAGGLDGDEILLVDVVWGLLEGGWFEGEVKGYVPLRAAVPKLSLTTQKIMAIW